MITHPIVQRRRVRHGEVEEHRDFERHTVASRQKNNESLGFHYSLLGPLSTAPGLHPSLSSFIHTVLPP